MKTAVELPDVLAADAKALAREKGVTLRELAISGLRAEIAQRTSPAPGEFRFRTVDGSGVRPEASGRSVSELAYDLPT